MMEEQTRGICMPVPWVPWPRATCKGGGGGKDKYILLFIYHYTIWMCEICRGRTEKTIVD